MKQVRQAVASVNSNAPLVHTRTLQQIYEGSMAQTPFALVMLAIAGSMALVLCVIGVYGVIAYTVAQRRHEVGIRMALGASGGAVKGMFLRHGLLLAGVGIALGLVAAAALSRLMSSLLFGVTRLDPATYGATAAVLLIAAMTTLPIFQRAAQLPGAQRKRFEALRHSREVTQVCSRKVTHQNDPFGAGQVRGLDAKESPATGSWVGYKDLARLRRG